MSLMKVAAMVTLFDLFCAGGAVEKIDISLLTGLDIDPTLKKIIGSMYVDMQGQIDELKKDKEALRVELKEVKIELTEVRSALYQFSNKTKTNI